MKIICPDCQKENNIVVKGGTICKHCEKPLDGYKFIKPLIPAFLLLAMGVGGSQAYQYYTDDSRYPVQIEYAIVDQCITSSGMPTRFDVLPKKRDACICALIKTQDEFKYSDFKKNQSEFVRSFRVNALSCTE